MRWRLLGSFWVVYYILFFLGSFFSRVRGRPLSYGGSDDTWSGWFGWNRPVLCIIVKRRSRTLGTECGTFLFVNINYILTFAFIDAVVHCNVLDVLEFGPLRLCLSPGRQWAPNYA